VKFEGYQGAEYEDYCHVGCDVMILLHLQGEIMRCSNKWKCFPSSLCSTLHRWVYVWHWTVRLTASPPTATPTLILLPFLSRSWHSAQTPIRPPQLLGLCKQNCCDIHLVLQHASRIAPQNPLHDRFTKTKSSSKSLLVSHFTHLNRPLFLTAITALHGAPRMTGNFSGRAVCLDCV
jgi:hypothetical protein